MLAFVHDSCGKIDPIICPEIIANHKIHFNRWLRAEGAAIRVHLAEMLLNFQSSDQELSQKKNSSFVFVSLTGRIKELILGGRKTRPQSAKKVSRLWRRSSSFRIQFKIHVCSAFNFSFNPKLAKQNRDEFFYTKYRVLQAKVCQKVIVS